MHTPDVRVCWHCCAFQRAWTVQTLSIRHNRPAEQREEHEIYALGDFKLANGSILPDAKIAYKTWGTLDAKRSNAIVYPTWYSGRFIQSPCTCHKVDEHLELLLHADLFDDPPWTHMYGLQGDTGRMIGS